MTKLTESTPSRATARSTKTSRRSDANRNRRSLNYLVIGTGVIFALLIGLVIYLNIRRSIPVDGQETLTAQGNLHVPAGSPSAFAYNSTPPTSGPHYDGMVEWGVSPQPQQYEYLLHNLEDGGVVIYYQCPEVCAETVTALEAIVQPYLSTQRKLVVVRNDPSWLDPNGQPLHKDMGAKIAVTAWGKLLKLDEVDATRIQAFIAQNEGIDHHSGV
jgi:hypothetical protein